MLYPGDVIGGRYSVDELVGQGGLSEVYRVRHVDLGSTHALKVLALRRPQLADRLLREGRIQAQLTHPHLVRVTDVVRHEGRVALVMEYLQPYTLEDRLQEGPLLLDEALPLFAQITAAVAFAHTVGVLHRDLKPSNVLLQRASGGLLAKVTDFGIAKVLDERGAGLTATGVAMGTPGYLAPEQLTDASDVDARTDVFALGVLLYEMLTGRMAFVAPDGKPSMRVTAEVEARPLAELVVVPDHIAEAVEQALTREREGRPPTVRAFAETVLRDRPDLLGLLDTQAATLDLDVPASTGESERVPPTVAPTLTVPTEPEPVRRSYVWVVPVAALVVFGIGALAVGAAWIAMPAAPMGPPEAPVARVEPPPRPPVTPEVVPPPASPESVDGGQPVRVEPPVVPPTESVAPPRPQGEADPQPVEVAGPPPAQTDPGPQPELEPRREPQPAPPTAASVPSLSGTWEGTSGGRPFLVRFSGEGASLDAEITITLGPTRRTTRGTARVEGSTVTIEESDGPFVYTGQLSGDRLAGSGMKGGKGKPMEFALSRVN